MVKRKDTIMKTEFIVLNKKFYYLIESEIMKKVILNLNFKKMSISELKRKLDSSDKVTAECVYKLENVGIIKRKKLNKKQYHPVMISLTNKGKKLLGDLK